MGAVGTAEMGKKKKHEEVDKEFSLEFSGFDITDEHPVYYKGLNSSEDDFFILHAYTPEHFTLLTYMEVAGVVTTHFSTITNKHELYQIIINGSYQYKKLKIITREEYLRYKNKYDNYLKSIHL